MLALLHIFLFCLNFFLFSSRIFKRFREIGDPGMIPRTMTPQEASFLRLPLSYLARIPELKVYFTY
jgi:hypothetical protein